MRVRLPINTMNRTSTAPSPRWWILTVVIFCAGFAFARWLGAPAPVIAAKVLDANPRQLEAATPSPEASPESAPNPAKSVRQPIRDALAGDDPLASAARVIAWLETTTAETFRELGEEPQRFPRPRFSGFDKEFRAAYFGAIAERWMALDPEGALPAMRRVQEELTKQYMPGELLNAAAKVRPELVLEKLPLENQGGSLQRHTRAALQSLAARDLKAARQFAERWTDENVRKDAASCIAQGVAENDPLGAAALAVQTKDQNLSLIALRAAERVGPGMVRQVLQAAGDQLGPYALSADFVLRHPDLVADMPDIPAPKNAGFSNAQPLVIADHIAPEERERLLASYDSLPASAREHVAAALAGSWARTEPQKAADWAIAHAKPEDGGNSANHAAQYVFLRWVNNDADAALAWWRALPSSPLRDALGTNASTYLAEDGRLDAALEIFKPSAGRTDESATTQLAQLLVARDPNTAGAWFATLPAGVATEQTARAVVSEWYAREPQAVARWVETMPPGAPRDQALRVFIEQAAQQSPSGAAEWVETVTEPKLRQKAAESVFSAMARDDPAGARQWMRALRGVDPEWHARFLRRMQ